MSNTDVSNDSEMDFSNILEIVNNISSINETDSKETLLLNALKPYLNKNRQKKINTCEKILSISSTLKTLNDLHIFDDLLKNTDE